MSIAFGPDFLWGAATAAFQIEGALAADGRGPSIWDGFLSGTAEHPLLDPRTGADHYHRLEEDLDLIAALGLRAYRFSIAWPRVMPQGGSAVNRRGLDFYRRLIDGLLHRGIRPVATISHFDLPQELEDRGGWTIRDTAERLGELAAVLAQELDNGVAHWITINEPWAAAWLGYGDSVLAPGRGDIDDALAATHHQLLGHSLAMSAIRAVRPDASVGATLGLAPVWTPGTHPADRDAAAAVDASLNRMCLEPLLLGHYPADVLDRYRAHERGLAAIQEGDLARIAQPMDFLGINYYYPRMVIAADRLDHLPGSLCRLSTVESSCFLRDFGAVEVVWTTKVRSSTGWPVDAAGLSEILMRLSNDYPAVPLMITENGAAFADVPGPDGYVDDADRVGYLAAHVAATAEAVLRGADVRGYFVWALLDNFEWNYGLSQTYGLIRVDPATQRRIPKASARWYHDLIAGGTLERGELRDAEAVAAGRI